jgi:hypothetical protein
MVTFPSACNANRILVSHAVSSFLALFCTKKRAFFLAEESAFLNGHHAVSLAFSSAARPSEFPETLGPVVLRRRIAPALPFSEMFF